MGDIPERPRPPPHRRRDKPQLSCDQCRSSKLRCDRQQPCGACTRRGKINSCNFVTTPSTSDAHRSAAPRQSAGSLQGRITELESLVVDLLKGQSLSITLPAPPRQTLARTDSLSSAEKPRDEGVSLSESGVLKLHESGATYVQGSHWEAVLTKIKGLKAELIDESKPALGSYLFYGPNRHAARDEILQSLPPRPVVDRLMALHFESYFVSSYLVHSKKFLREYASFWEDPSALSVPVAWIGLLFSMLYVSTQLQIFTADLSAGQAERMKADYLAMKEVFRERTVQCLVSARYTRGGPFILETLITLLVGEFVLLKDGANDGRLSINMILQIAIRMGYHRDGDKYTEVSLFDSEMRRRVWTVILQLDLTLALEMGVPRSASDSRTDTESPGNLNDCDFDEDSTELPLSRPETEWTPILPLIARRRLISALGPICDINADIGPPSSDEIRRVDALLEDVHKRAIPKVLRWQPMTITDSPNLVVQRVSVETTYHKARILLYRKALTGCPASCSREPGRQYVHICLDSALTILSFQELLHEESQPFGRLSQLRWKVVHIFNQDVLLATSVLCLYLQDADRSDVSENTTQTSGSYKTEEIRQRLTTSHKIWSEMSAASAEAAKVARALSVVLGSTETSANDGMGYHTYDFPTECDAMHLDLFGSAFNDPLAFFDNILQNE